MSNTIKLDVPSEWRDEWESLPMAAPSALAGTTVEAEFTDEGELEGFDVSDGHWGSPDDLEASELYDAICAYPEAVEVA